MPKYYVKSGELEIIVDGDMTAFEAVGTAIHCSLGGQTLDVDGQLYVDERGFRGPNPDESIVGWMHRVSEEGMPAHTFAISTMFGEEWDR